MDRHLAAAMAALSDMINALEVRQNRLKAVITDAFSSLRCRRARRDANGNLLAQVGSKFVMQ